MEKQIILTKQEEYFKSGTRYTVYESDNGLRFEFKQDEESKFEEIPSPCSVYDRPWMKETKVYGIPRYVDMQFIRRV